MEQRGRGQVGGKTDQCTLGFLFTMSRSSIATSSLSTLASEEKSTCGGGREVQDDTRSGLGQGLVRSERAR